MKQKRAKVKFLMTVLNETYWQVSLRQRLERLKLCLGQDDRKYGYKHEKVM